MKLIDKIKNYDFDIIELPSRGMFYNLGRSYIYIKLLTAKEENILSSPFLSEYGEALDLALESVILDDIKVDNLLTVDRKAIIMFLRSKAISDAFELEIDCPDCGTKFTQEFRLSNFEMSDTVEAPGADGLYSVKFKLKEDKEFVIKLIPLTHGADKAVKKYHQGKTSTYELIYQIHSINDNDDSDYIEKFVNKMPINKFQSLKKKIDSIVPRIFEELTTECSYCVHKEKTSFKIDDGHLKFEPNYRINYEEEIFLIEYYGNGGFQKDELYEMSISQRKATLEKINREVEKKNKAEKDQASRSKNTRA